MPETLPLGLIFLSYGCRRILGFRSHLVFQAHFDDLFDVGHAFIVSLALRVATLQLRYFLQRSNRLHIFRSLRKILGLPRLPALPELALNRRQGVAQALRTLVNLFFGDGQGRHEADGGWSGRVQ